MQIVRKRKKHNHSPNANFFGQMDAIQHGTGSPDVTQYKGGGWLDSFPDGGQIPRVVTPLHKPSMEDEANTALGYPMWKAGQDADILKGDDNIDNLRHAPAGRYTSEGIQNIIPPNVPGRGLIGFVGANAMGVAHEIQNPNREKGYSYWDTFREGAEDTFNNLVGATVGSLPLSDDNKTKTLKYLSLHNWLPDGYGKVDNAKGNMYIHKKGGVVNSYPDGGVTTPTDENKDWLVNWYKNRSQGLPDGQAKDYLNQDLPNILTNIRLTQVQRNAPLGNDTLGNSILSKNVVQLGNNAPSDVELHELTHIADKNNFINYLGASPIEKNLLPKGEQYRDHYKYFSNPDELHANIMALRKQAGFKPEQTIDETTLDNFIKNYKGGNYNVDTILKMSDKPKLIYMLNNMVSDNTNKWLDKV